MHAIILGPVVNGAKIIACKNCTCNHSLMKGELPESTLGLSYKEHKTNEYVWQQVNILAGRREFLLSTVIRRKLSWFGHVCRHDTPPTIIPQGTVDGRPHKSWRDNVKEWTGQSLSSLLRITNNRSQWLAITAI